MQRRYVDFRLAHTLNDYAYRQRLLGLFGEAQAAIEECIALKEGGAALPRSLAVSLSEYSQILVVQGRLREALTYNGKALQILDKLIEEGDKSLNAEKGMLLTERAQIYMQQARVEEAKQLFQQAVDLIGNSTSRQAYHRAATEQLKVLHEQQERLLRYQLDTRWFERYLALASYDELAWLAHAGPFSSEEQREWERLCVRRHEEEAAKQMADLIIRSRQREFTNCIVEGHEPRLQYPGIPIDEVVSRIAGFEALKAEIGECEQNAIVRKLYRDTIEEHLTILKLCETVHKKNVEGVWRYNQLLYGLPTVKEMKVALQPLFSMLIQARDHPKAGLLSETLLAQLKQWRLFPQDFIAEHDANEAAKYGQNAENGKIEKKSFSHTAVRRFFEEVLHSVYRLHDWRVVIAPTRDHAYVDVDLQTVALPARPFSIGKVRELLAEEIETHVYRSVAGRASSLALLGSGTAGYSSTEEGLAKHYIQQLPHAQNGNKSWLGTLATGLMAGVLTPPITFYTLYTFLSDAFFLRNLLSGRYETDAEAKEAAQQEALARAARTVRGVPDLTTPGVCSLKDRIYLQGYLDVAHILETVEIDRLLVGKIGIAQLDDMAELGILAPSIPHRSLALDPNLSERIAVFGEE